MHDIGCSGLVHWDDPEGWDGKGGGRGFRMGNTFIFMMDSSQNHNEISPLNNYNGFSQKDKR